MRSLRGEYGWRREENQGLTAKSLKQKEGREGWREEAVEETEGERRARWQEDRCKMS